jgi:hypothetical protein
VRRRLLALALFALLTPAIAQGSRTLACSTDFQTRVACYIEQTVWTLGPFEFSIGVDTLAAAQSHVAPYAAFSWHAPTWSATIEAATPPFAFTGRSNPIRFSFTTRW